MKNKVEEFEATKNEFMKRVEKKIDVLRSRFDGEITPADEGILAATAENMVFLEMNIERRKAKK